MSAQEGPTRHPVDGSFEAFDAHISESDLESNCVSLPHLTEDGCTAQSGFGCEVPARRDVIFNELFAERPDNCTNRFGNADVRPAI